ncbi:MAG: hypothetical protein ABH834_08005 [Candidatus Altiarchaeota archaeon]
MWSYKELKHLVINGERPAQDLALELNQMFHEGHCVRSAADVCKIRSTKTILQREKRGQCPEKP